MTDLKRLHDVHYSYPYTVRRQGKTYYCFDKLLRVAQLGEVKEQVYVTNTQQATTMAHKDFIRFLFDADEGFSSDIRDLTVSIGDCKIKFISLAGKEKLKGSYDAIVEDVYEDR
jgi:hypothetical protein